MPNKLDKIASLISEIHKGQIQGKIKFVIGDGFYSQRGTITRQEIIDNARTQGKEIKNISDEDITCWNAYDYYRVYSANHMSPKRYFYMRYLLSTGIVSSIITTNYDLRFDSIFERDPLPQGMILNPIINSGEDNGNDFYGEILSVQNKLRFRKIHGSFSHISFIQPEFSHNHIFKLPNIRVDRIYEDHIIHHDDFCQSLNLNCSCNRMAHYIDYNFLDRNRYFNRVINGAIQDLNADDTGSVITMGFTGRFNPSNPSDPMNEELVPHLLTLSRNVPVYTILAPFQNIKESFLYTSLASKETALRGNIGDIFRDILIKYFDKISIDGNKKLEEIDKSYLLWNNLFNPIPDE